MKSSYKRQNITNAIFDNENGNVFSDDYDDYLKTNDVQNFINFTVRSTNDLDRIIRSNSPTKGGYLVFTEYSFLSKKFFAIYLIRNVNSVLFKREQRTFQINPTQRLELDKLAMACTINHQRYLDSDGKYLSFINKQSSDISRYFINWLGAKDEESSKTYTEALLKLAKNVDKLPADEDGNTYTITDFLDAINDFILTRPDKTADLRMLGKQFYDDEDILIDLAEKLNLTIDTKFSVDTTVMKNFVRIDINIEGILLRFSRAKVFDQLVTTDGDKVTIHSKTIADKIRSETK